MKNFLVHSKRLLGTYLGIYHKKFVLDKLIFFVTYKCNFRCRTCFYAEVMDKSDTGRDKELSIDEIKKVSSSIGRLHTLLISGGEPFLRDDLPQICRIFYLQNKISQIHLPTNGFYPEKIYDCVRLILLHCPGAFLNLSLSLDGLEKTHDKIKGVAGSFGKTVETIRRLSSLKKEFANFDISVITVVNKINLPEIIGLSEFIRNNLPVDGHGPSPLRGNPYDKNMLAPSSKEWDKLSEELLKYKMTADPLACDKVEYVYKIYGRVLKGEKLPFRCQAGNIIGVLEPAGEVRLCELKETVGNVRSVNYDFKKIWFSDKANEAREKIKDCSCTHACFLGSTIELYLPALIKFRLWRLLKKLKMAFNL